jgi:hypothetical protein
MNSKTQPDLHPDAESLNAFVEQALAERERGEILTHLAGCGRCREVVFLAQEAATEMESAVDSPDLRLPARQRSWLRNWWVVWAPAGALAAVVSLAYVVHLRRVEMASELAKVTPPAAMRDEGISARPPAPPMGMQAAPPLAAAAPAKPAPRSMKAPIESVASRQLPHTAATMTAEEASELPHTRQDEAAASPGTSGAGNPAPSAAAEYKPGVAAAAREVEQEQAAADSQIRSMAAKATAQARPNEPATRAAAGGMLKSAAPAALPAVSSTPPAAFEAGSLHGTGRVFAVYKASPTKLPSGLPAVSTASMQHSTLAVDRLGTVYLSEDSGSDWESVANQWSGRAVSVRVQPAVDANSGALQTGPPVFVLVNDQGQVWVSTGGRIWKAK